MSKNPKKDKSPGERNPRCTQEELEQRIEFTSYLLSRRLYKSDIKKQLARRYNLGSRACEDYISRARAKLVENSQRPREEHRIDSISFYESILRAPDTDMRYKMAAQEKLDWIFGTGHQFKEDEEKGGMTGDQRILIVKEVITSRDQIRPRQEPDHDD